MTNETVNLTDPINLSQASKLMRGRGGRAPSVETVRRWANPKRGCWPAGRQGKQILLKTVRLNGELVTTAAWVEEFERQRVQLGMRVPDPSFAYRSGRTRTAAHRRAVEELKREGLGQAKD